MSTSQQRLLRTILTGAPGFLVLKNQNLAFEVVNPAFCQLLGKAPDEIVGKKDRDFFPEAEAKACEEADMAVMKAGLARHQEQGLTGQGETHWLDITRTPVLDDDGDAVGILLFGRDISPIKKREQAVAEAEAKAGELRTAAEQAEARAKTAEDALEEARRQGEQAAAQARQEAEAEVSRAKSEAESAVNQAKEEAAAQTQALEQAEARVQTLEGELAQQKEQAAAEARAAQAKMEEARQALEQCEMKRGELEARLGAVEAKHAAALESARKVVRDLEQQ